MKPILALLAAATLSACGVEVASSAATAAAIKKQELEQGKKNLEQTKQKLDASLQQVQQQQQTETAADKQ